MAETVGHSIRFTLRHTPQEQGGQLEILCEDSGEGFDYRPCLAETSTDNKYSGRGLMLLRQISSSLSFNDKGNQVGVVYDWKFT